MDVKLTLFINYLGMLFLSTFHEMLTNILLSRWTPYVYEITENYQIVFQHNHSTDDQVFWIW